MKTALKLLHFSKCLSDNLIMIQVTLKHNFLRKPRKSPSPALFLTFRSLHSLFIHGPPLAEETETFTS